MISVLLMAIVVNPARAGMIPNAKETAENHGRKPRASGDDPSFTMLGICDAW